MDTSLTRPDQKARDFFRLLLMAFTPLLAATLIGTYMFAPEYFQWRTWLPGDSKSGMIVFSLWLGCAFVGIFVVGVGGGILGGRKKWLMYLLVVPVIIWPFRMALILIAVMLSFVVTGGS